VIQALILSLIQTIPGYDSSIDHGLIQAFGPASDSVIDPGCDSGLDSPSDSDNSKSEPKKLSFFCTFKTRSVSSM
jgi:hypothetical protein